ncbi:MAG: hypothetical protein CR988_02095 [Treponema sp.]|nr:MAG: hypothetical protein CR988_02095 [Treponema sp.]
MKKMRLVALQVLVVLSVFSCALLDKIISGQEESIFALKSQIVSMKFEVSKQGNNEMLVSYAFYNLSGQKLGLSQTVKLRGSELFIDCRVERLNSKYSIVFPYAFYSNIISASEGRVIVNDYKNSSGYPGIFEGVNYSEKRKIQKLYDGILNNKPTKHSFRSSPHIVIRPNKTGYKLVSRVRGGIEILKSE